MDYQTLRDLVDTWGLLAMTIVFVALCAWPFLPGSARENEQAANMIFGDDDDA